MKKVPLRLRTWGFALLAAAVLTACGGGGSDSPPPPPGPTVTAIPDSLSITAPASAESAAAVQFGNSSGNLAGLKYQWDFGDGTTSADAAPSHSFASGGEFDVVLKVTNEGGVSREVRTKLSITNVANVRGLECSGASNTGWCWQNPRPTGNRVNSVFFLNATTGWRGGDNGEIFKTTDGGTTWVRQSSGIAASIYGIKFFDANTGWATGAFGAMLRTTDGGTTWNVSKFGESSSSYDLDTINAVDAKTVYVGRTGSSNFYGYIYASTDGGVTWRTTNSPQAITSKGKLWYLNNNGLSQFVKVSSDGGQEATQVLELKPAAGTYYFDTASLVATDDQRAAVYTRNSAYDYTNYKYTYYDTFYTTLDGGATWSKVEVKNADTSTGVQRLLTLSADGKTLVAAGNAGALISKDGGATWTASGPATGSYYYGVFSIGDSDLVANTSTGLWLSEDLGQTWTKLSTVSSQATTIVADRMRRIDAGTLFATDSVGSSYLSKDKGQNWTRVVTVPDQNGCCGEGVALAFSDGKNGFMTDAAGKTFTTKDGGATWQPRNVNLGRARKVQFVSKTTGWMVDYDGRLYKTTDGGLSWWTGASAQTPFHINVYFANQNLGWSQRYYGGAPFAYTKDGGETWTELTLPFSPASLRFGEQGWVAVGGNGSVYVSTDSGKTWNARYTGTSSSLIAVEFSDAKNVWAVGSEGTLLKSEDSGAKWAQVRLPVGNATLRDVRFANAKVGWIVGDGGVILATVDGGKTWRTQSSGTTLPLYSIQAADINTAWITGASNLVLATGTGGN